MIHTDSRITEKLTKILKFSMEFSQIFKVKNPLKNKLG